MIIVNNEQVIFCDVDDTLVLHDLEKHKELPTVTVKDPYCGALRTLPYHAAHVRMIIERAKRGAHIVVMSAGGYQWAQAVVEALGLEDSVSQCMSKPITIIDDLPIEGALGATMYLSPNSKWKAE